MTSRALQKAPPAAPSTRAGHPPDRLVVVWAEPKGPRFVVGDFWRSDRTYFFGYRAELLDEAMQAGFRLLVEFPEQRGLDQPYQSTHPFRTFQQRIPSPTRPDYRKILESWGVDSSDDPMEALAKSGGVLLTDRLELSEFRPPDDSLQQPLSVRLAGESHYHPQVEQLAVGQALRLRRDPQNPTDSFATAVLVAADHRQVGWVPREYVELVSTHLDAGTRLEARIERRLLPPEDRGRWVVKLLRPTETAQLGAL